MPHHRCFTVNFAKLLKALCRTPLVSASNFNSTFLTLRPRQTYIYVFPALRFLDISKPLHVPYRSYNQFHNILRLSDVLPNFPFTTSERCAVITFKHGTHELPHEFPNDLRVRKS